MAENKSIFSNDHPFKIIFMAVGTPSGPDGSANHTYPSAVSTFDRISP